MPGLFEKLNVLVKSNINQLLKGERATRRGVPDLAQLGKGADREIAAMRKQVERALSEEDRLENEMATLQRAIEAWDRRADDALMRGDEATARHAVRQMQRNQQHRAMIVADLHQHRRATSELINRVNELEALVAEARHQEKTAAPPAAGPALGDRLRQAREAVVPPGSQRDETEDLAIDEQVVEDDLARRRARLSL